MTKYLKDISGLASGKIVEHRDGTATLTISIPGKRIWNRKYKNIKSALSTWYRMTA